MSKLLICNARLINEGEIRDVDVLLDGERIEKIAGKIEAAEGWPGLRHQVVHGCLDRRYAGLPLVQHALQILFDLVATKAISLELLVDRACHASADLFGVTDRGYVREGYFADLVIVDPNKSYRVQPSNIIYKCGWSPFEGHEFSSNIDTTIVNGRVVFSDGKLSGEIAGQQLEFTRAR